MLALRTLTVALLAALTLAVTANAAPPIKAGVWAQAKAAWISQANARGLHADCTPYSPSGLIGMRCDFGDRKSAAIYSTSTPCSYSVSVANPDWGFPLTRRATLNYCKAGWVRALPAPWKPMAA